jgi:iron complex outermembrane receptor protein
MSNQKKYIKLLTSAFIPFSFSTPTVLLADDLGTIRVLSTTIDDKFENKRDEPSSFGFITEQEIDKDRPQNIQEMLRRIPGITTELQNGDSLKIHIRGVENQVFMGERPGVAVVIDGVPVFERTGKVNIDIDNIDSIKVIKGGASYLFGDDALGGAVIITTKRGADNAGYRVDLEAGSFDYYKALVKAGFENETANGHLQISRRETDGYYDDSDSKADYINGKLQYYIDDTSDFTFGMELSDREKNSHGTVTGKTAAKEDPKSKDIWSYNDYANNYDVDLQKFFVTYSKDFGSSHLILNTYQFTDDTKFDSDPLDNDPTRYSYDNDYDQTQRGVKSEYRIDGTRFAWMAGLDLRENDYDNKVFVQNNDDIVRWTGLQNGDLYEYNKTDESVSAFYGELKYKVTDNLIFTFNARNDYIDLDYTDKLDSTDNGDEDFNVNSFRLGGNYALRENLDFYANASTGFRTPTPEQLFVGNSHPDRRVAPNPELDPEESLNLEIGFRMNTSFFDIPHDIDLSIFQLDRDDYIQATSGQYTTTGSTDTNMYDNIGDVRHRGLELSLSSDYTKKFSWDIAYTYLDAFYQSYDNYYLKTVPVGGTCLQGSPVVVNPPGPRPPYTERCLTHYDNSDNNLPRTPRHKLNAILRYRFDPHWTLSTEMEAQSSYYADEVNENEISGRAVFNAWINYDRKIGDHDWSFFVRVDNLFDRFYYNTARSYDDRNEDGYYNEEDLSIVVNPGTVFTSGLTVRF